MSADFEPRIVGFLCNWCTYAAADTAGVSRLEQPPNVDIIRMAFAEGADGVIVSGCHPPGDCHYNSGNYKTFRRMPLVEALLAQYGVEKERFYWGWISGAEAPKWAQLVRDFTEQVRVLGPLNWKRELESKEE